MSAFDDWHEDYERDGEELMLYNTYDLKAAFEAGGASKHKILEHFCRHQLEQHKRYNTSVHEDHCPTRYYHGNMKLGCECTPTQKQCDCAECTMARDFLQGEVKL